MCSRIAFAWGAVGGLVRIRMPSAAETASNALVNRQSRSRGAHWGVVRPAGFLSRLRAA